MVVFQVVLGARCECWPGAWASLVGVQAVGRDFRWAFSGWELGVGVGRALGNRWSVVGWLVGAFIGLLARPPTC